MTRLQSGSQVEDLRVLRVLTGEPLGQRYQVENMAGERFELLAFQERTAPSANAHSDTPHDQVASLGHYLMAHPHPALRAVQKVIRTPDAIYWVLQDRPGAQAMDPEALLTRWEHSVPACMDALSQLHQNGYLHGQLDASLLRSDDQQQLCIDVPMASALQQTMRPPADPSAMGTAPEQLDRPEGSLVAASDVYGLAASLATIFTGRATPTATARKTALRAGQADPLDELGLDQLPRALGTSLLNGLSLAPAQRPKSMRDWHASLASPEGRTQLLRDTSAEADTEESRPRLPLILGGLLIALMVGAAVFLFSDQDRPLDAWFDQLDPGAERDRGPRVSAPSSEERARWEAALEADTLLGYQKFLQDYGSSVFAAQAQLQIDVIDERLWAELAAEDSRPAYADYLEQLPTGLHQAEALRRIEAIDQEAARQERERLERERLDAAAWAQARGERTIESLGRYIRDWPAGLHIEEAQRIQRSLVDAANDSEAFARAQRLDTRDAFQAYIDAFPRGQHVAEALQGLEDRTLLAGKPFRDCALCPELRVMPTGRFLQGASPNDALALEQEQPARTVAITRPFAVGIFEVTISQWDACFDAGGCSYRPPDNGWGREDRPVIMVSWNDAQEYVSWLSDLTGEQYRLPTESEWEYVARADERSPWLGGTPEGLCRFANIAGLETGFRWQHQACDDRVPVGTTPVGAYASNKAGLFDVIGNVAEWTADCLNLSYLDAPTDGSAWTRGICSSHMTRGGSWLTGSRDIRLSSRFNLKNGDRNDFTGFRVVREIDE